MTVDEDVLYTEIVEAVLDALGLAVAPWEAEEIAQRVIKSMEKIYV